MTRLSHLLLGLLSIWLFVAAGDPVLDPRANELRAKAERLERAARLSEAQAAWIELAGLLTASSEREEAGDRARSLELRLLFRREIAEACSLRREAMREVGIVSANERDLQTTAAVVPWVEANFELLANAAKTAKVSKPARTGLMHERMARGTPKEIRAGLTELGELVQKGEFTAQEAWPLVARARGEQMPPRGYQWSGSKWERLEDAEALAAATQLADLLTALRKAKASDRDEAFDALVAAGPEGKAAALVALRERAETAASELEKRGTLAQLTKLADSVRELQERRDAVLTLVFDEDRYFYPYTPPECPPERAKLYAAIQREIDEKVARVKELWDANPSVKLPKDFSAALDELRWARRRAKNNGAEVGGGVAFPTWLENLDASTPTLSLRSFALHANQKADIAHSRAVQLLNETRFARFLKDPKAGGYTDPLSKLEVAERDQVNITNDYRVMLGRRALAWDPRLQSAAQGHSDWMSLKGILSHDEDDPRRRTVGQRTRLAGYEAGSGENCSMGRPGAMDTHTGWAHSSGHHRNLLSPGHTEIGSAISGNYWTQNFGSARDFEREFGQ